MPTLAMARLSRLSLRSESCSGVVGFFFFSCSSLGSFSPSVVPRSLSASIVKSGSNCPGLIPESGDSRASPFVSIMKTFRITGRRSRREKPHRASSLPGSQPNQGLRWNRRFERSSLAASRMASDPSLQPPGHAKALSDRFARRHTFSTAATSG